MSILIILEIPDKATDLVLMNHDDQQVPVNNTDRAVTRLNHSITGGFRNAWGCFYIYIVVWWGKKALIVLVLFYYSKSSNEDFSMH